MRKILKIILLLQLLIASDGILAQELKFRVDHFGQDQMDMAAKVEGRDDGDGSIYAVIKVTSDIEDDNLTSFKFDFNNMRHEAEMRDGELWLFVQRNAKNVTIRREGYKAVKYSFPAVKAGATYRLHLSVQTPKIMQRVLQFKVSPANEGAIVRVKSEDSSDDYQLWGSVDAQGSIDRLLDTGVYLYEITADNYRKSEGRIRLVNGNDNYIENVALMPDFGFLQIDDTYGITGAEVYINNKKVGTVPYKSGRMKCRNDYLLMISNGELYKTYNATFAIRQNETTKLSPKLESNFAETTIKVDGNAAILVNGVEKGKGLWKGPLRAGTYNVECRLPSHESTRKQIIVKPNVSETFVIEKPHPIEGSLYVKSNPSGAQVYLDDNNTMLETPCKIDKVLVGKRQITVMLANHKTETRIVEVKKDETTTVDVKLGNIAKMTINTNPSGANLYINGQDKGLTPFADEMASGEYDVKFVKKKYAVYSKRIHLDSSNPVQTFNLCRQYQQKNQFYMQPMLQVGSYTSVGVAVGCFFSGFNVESDFLYGLSKETIYWNMPNLTSGGFEEDELSSIYVGGKVGYGFIYGSKLRVTPQLGCGLLSVSGTNSDCYALKGTLGIRADYVLANHIGIVVAPEFGIPLSKSDVFKNIADVSSKTKGWGCGFNCSFGLNIYI